MKKGVQLKIKQKIESIEGCACREAVYNIYFVRLISVPKVCKLWNINNRTFMRLFAEYGFKFRTGTEAVTLQWVNADQRKINTSNKLKETRKWSNPALGCSRPDAVERMEKNNPMFNLNIRKKANDKTIETYNREPKRHNIYHKKLTECEQIIFDFLISKGINCIGNELINGRFIDIYLPDLKTGIECINQSRFPLAFDRHKQICQDNTKIIYCVNSFIKKRSFEVLYQYIIDGQIIDSLPSINGENTMIFGRRNGFIFDTDLFKISLKSFNVNSCNILYVSTTTDN